MMHLKIVVDMVQWQNYFTPSQ